MVSQNTATVGELYEYCITIGANPSEMLGRVIAGLEDPLNLSSVQRYIDGLHDEAKVA
jgi:hypothetical protein